jgi:hypothetical protein
MRVKNSAAIEKRKQEAESKLKDQRRREWSMAYS